jgi:ectoine hydroxylase-related dioxygenase (phytanoyl-CoA dioxygenase family)
MNIEVVDHELLPSTEDVTFYHEHGWYISKKILPDNIIDDAVRGYERYYAGERDYPLSPISDHFNWKPEHGDVLRLNAYPSLQIEQLSSLVRYSIIGAIAAMLSGSQVIRLFRDQLIYKPSEKRSHTHVGWHVDLAYWLTCTCDNMLTAWVPFHDCDKRSGTLTMLDGSHKWLNNLELRTFHHQNLQALKNIIDTAGQPIVEVPMNLKKGQVSFHHCRTIHGSYRNSSDRPRISLAIHMQNGENRYRVHQNAGGKRTYHLNDLLCRELEEGVPDYADPVICPVLWPASNHGTSLPLHVRRSYS